MRVGRTGNTVGVRDLHGGLYDTNVARMTVAYPGAVARTESQ